MDQCLEILRRKSQFKNEFPVLRVSVCMEWFSIQIKTEKNEFRKKIRRNLGTNQTDFIGPYKHMFSVVACLICWLTLNMQASNCN